MLVPGKSIGWGDGKPIVSLIQAVFTAMLVLCLGSVLIISVQLLSHSLVSVSRSNKAFLSRVLLFSTASRFSSLTLDNI